MGTILLQWATLLTVVASEQTPTKLESAAETMVKQAVAAAERGDWRQVIELVQPLTASVDTYEVNHLLGQAYRQMDLPVEATWYFRRAVQLQPDAAGDLLELGELHLARGWPALAINALESVVSLGVADGRVHYRLALAYQRCGRPVGRTSIVSLAQAVPESTSGPWYVWEAIEGQTDRYRVCARGSAIYHLQRAMELGLDDPQAVLLYADIWFSAGQYERARDLYEMMESIVPREQMAGYHYCYGQSLYWLDDLNGFEEHIQRAVELDSEAYRPKLLDCYTMLADRYCVLGDVKQYIRYLELAVKQSPRSAELRYKLGNALSEAQRRGEAAAQWQVVLQLEPYHPDRERLLKLLNYQDVGGPTQTEPPPVDKP